MSDDDYLFDKSGEPDADVARIERALRPLGRRDDAPIPAIAPRTRWMRLALATAAAAAAAAVFVAVMMPKPEVHDSTVARDPIINAVSNSAPVRVDDWIETTNAGRELQVFSVRPDRRNRDADEREVDRPVFGISDLLTVSLRPNSRLQLRHLSDETTRLYLARGSLEARVAANARPRFFQVDTDAARCVDLGCRYTLDVTDDGVATVRVVTGQVAFETETREVFVPAGAVCVARKGRGPGTPRFEDARESVAAAFDAYDVATDASTRRGCALSALDAVRDGRDTLPAWHLLQDPDVEVVRAAQTKLAVVAGRCEIADGAAAAKVRAAWKDWLEGKCW